MPSWKTVEDHSKVVRWFRTPEVQNEYFSDSFTGRSLAALVQFFLPLGKKVGKGIVESIDVGLRNPSISFIICMTMVILLRLMFPPSPIQKIALMFGLAALFLIVFGMLLRRAFPTSYHLLLAITVVSLLVKIILIPTIFPFISSPDERAVYHTEAIAILSAVQSGTPYTAILLGYSPYSALLASLYAVGGAHMEIGKLGNALLLMMTAIVIFALARQIFDERVAIGAFLFVHFEPQLTIWSVQLLRESLIILLIVAALYFLVQFVKHRAVTFGSATMFAAIIWLLYWIRPHIAFILLATAAATIMVFFFWQQISRTRRFAFALLLIAILSIFIVSQGLWNDPTLHIQANRYFSLEAAQGARNWISMVPGTLYEPDARVDTISGALQLLPKSALVVLLAPYPTHITDAKWMIYYGINVLAYPVLALAIVGVFLGFRHQLRLCFPLFVFVILALGVYALSDPSIGGIIRHRMQIWIVLLLFAAQGMMHISRNGTVWENRT